MGTRRPPHRVSNADNRSLVGDSALELDLLHRSIFSQAKGQRASDLADWAVLHIGVVGDYAQTNETHRATSAAFGHAADVLGQEIEVSWVPTIDLQSIADVPRTLAGFGGLCVAPGSPYQDMDGALAAITFARRNDIPLLGTCGGFQHMVIEYAREVLGVTDAEHAEYDPYASRLFVTPLSCSLAGREMEVELLTDSLAARSYGTTQATERYYCNFGLNPQYRRELEEGGLRVSGVDQDGEVRVMEVPGLRFFVGTLFVPQASSTPSTPHPLVASFVEEAARPVVAQALEQDAEEIWRLRTVVEDWLEQLGIVQWDKGEVSKLDVSDQVSRGEWHVTRDGGAICAALRLLWADPMMWGELDGFAGYIHGLMIDRNHAGQGLGRRLLDWAERQARRAGAPSLRLDCVETNARLRGYYVEQGFREVGRQDFGGRWHPVVLMEKSLMASGHPASPQPAR